MQTHHNILTYSHVEYITFVESKEVSISNYLKEKGSISADGKNLLYADFLCSLFMYRC
jgi:hypothetical protein